MPNSGWKVPALLSGAPFSILNLSGLKVWARANASYTDAGKTTLAAADADVVYTADDQSANDADLVQSDATLRPKYYKGRINNLPALLFDGSNDTLRSAAGKVTATTVSSIWIVVVGRMLNSALGNYAIAGVSDAADGLTQYALIQDTNSGGTMKWLANLKGNAEQKSNYDGASDLIPHLIETLWDGSNVSQVIDGTATTLASTNATLLADGKIDWGAAANLLPSNLMTSELLVFAPAPNASNRAAVRSFLNGLYGLPFSTFYVAKQTIYTDANWAGSAALVRTSGGRLLAYWRSGTGDSSTDGTIKQAYSDDNGANWTNGSDLDTSAVDYMAPCEDTIIKLANGNLIRFYRTTHTPLTGTSWKSCCKISTDSGATWGSEIIVSQAGAQILSGGWWIPYGRPIEVTAGGNILCPGYGRDASNNYVVALARSTDAGATWAYYSTIVSKAAEDVNETTVVDMGSGTYIAFVRNDTSTPYRVVSTDYGATWGAPAAMSIPCSAPSAMYGNGLIWLNQKGVTVGLRISPDSGVTWYGPGEVNLANYSSLLVENSRVYVLSATQASKTITFFARGYDKWI